MRIVSTLVAYLVALALVAAIALLAALFLAGPHAGLLPASLEAVVLGLGWLAVLVLPVLVARRVWIRLGRKKSRDESLVDAASAPATRDIAQLTAGLAAPAAQLIRSDAPTGSQLGGDPRLPAGVPWPQWRGRRLDFMARLSLADLQAVTPLDWLPRSGALLFFYDAQNQPWGFDPADRGSCAVLHVTDEDAGDEDSEGGLLPRIDIAFRRIESLPSRDREPVSALSFTDEENEAYEALREARHGEDPRHQVGGFPFPVQNDSMELEAQLASNGLYCGDDRGYCDPRAEALVPGSADWQLLLQLDTDDDAGVMWGDCGTLYFWVRTQEASQARFENAWLILQCS